MRELEAFLNRKVGSLPAWMGSNWTVAGLFTVITFILLSSVLVFHRTTFFVNLDNVDQFYTWYQKLATSLHHGYLPVWNSNVFSGQSFAGELQPGVFYPINLLWVAIFGSINGISYHALDYLVALHFAIAAFGCYLLVHQLGAKKWASFLTGVIFAFSGMVAFRSISQTVIFFGLALLPYPLYFLAKFHSTDSKKARWLVASGGVLGLIILSGHIDPFFYALLALVIFELVHLWKNFAGTVSLGKLITKSVKNFIIITLSAVAIGAPQLWVSSSYLPHAYRIQAAGYIGPGEKLSYGAFSKAFNVDIHEFSNLLDPVTYQVRDGNNLFIGLAPLGIIVLVLALAGSKLKKTKLLGEHSHFVISLLTLSILAMIGYATWFAVVLYELPFVYQIRELGRYSILFHLSLMVVLAASLQAVVKLKLTKQQKWKLLLAGSFLLINSVYILLLRHRILSLHYALQLGLVALVLLTVAAVESSNMRKLLIGLIILVTAGVNTLWFLQPIKSGTKTPASYSLPSKLVAVLEQTNGKYRVEIMGNAVPVNIGNVYNVQTIGGYAATVYAPYFEFTQKINNNIDQSFVRDLLGVQLVVEKQVPAKNEEVVYSDPASGIYVVKRPSALPKFFTSEQAGSLDRASYQPLNVVTQKYDDHYEKYSVMVNKDTTAVVSEIAYKGWEAKVDGRPAQLKTYWLGGIPLLKSLDISAGTHTVELSYKPFKIF